jgi:hypothetical protein
MVDRMVNLINGRPHSGPMPNKPRPRCPKDGAAMQPLFAKRPRGSGYVRAGDSFYCSEHGLLAKGRGRSVKVV